MSDSIYRNAEKEIHSHKGTFNVLDGTQPLTRIEVENACALGTIRAMEALDKQGWHK